MRYALHKRLYLAVILSLLLCSFVTHHVHADSPSAFRTFQLIAFDELSGNPDPSTGDDFGHSIAVSGDTAVVGAPASGMGAAHVYRFDGNTWKQEVILTASNGGFFNGFGRSAAISGNTIIIGAPFDSESGFFSGAVYVFAYDGTTWNQEDKLTASDPSFGAGFGYSLAIDRNTLVVGTANADSSYVFEYSGGSWVEKQPKLEGNDTVPGNRFGWSVGISGNTIVVGAYGDDDNGSSSGSAYIFARNQGGADNWGQVTKITALDDGAADDYLGWSVSISGDTVVVGAYGDDDNGSSSGSAYIFARNQGGADNWGQVTKITALDDGAADDYFGWSVSISGDTLVVGAPFSTNEGISAGAAYAFILPPANQDPAATFEFTRAKVDWKKGKIKLDGQVVLPEGVTYEYLDRKGSVKLSFELNQPVEAVDDSVVLVEAVDDDLVVVLEVKGRKGEKWQYKNRHAFGLTEYKVHWKDDQTGKVKIKADFDPGSVDVSQLTPKLVVKITLDDLLFDLTIDENGQYDCKLKRKKWDFRNKP